jgi:hypothetical protein
MGFHLSLALSQFVWMAANAKWECAQRQLKMDLSVKLAISVKRIRSVIPLLNAT